MKEFQIDFFSTNRISKKTKQLDVEEKQDLVEETDPNDIALLGGFQGILTLEEELELEKEDEMYSEIEEDTEEETEEKSEENIEISIEEIDRVTQTIQARFDKLFQIKKSKSEEELEELHARIERYKKPPRELSKSQHKETPHYLYVSRPTKS